MFKLVLTFCEHFKKGKISCLEKYNDLNLAIWDTHVKVSLNLC